MQVNQGVAGQILAEEKYHSLTVTRIVHGGYVVSALLSPHQQFSRQLFAAATFDEVSEWIKKNIA